MSNHATAAPARATPKTSSRRTSAATTPSDCRTEVIAQLEQLNEQLAAIYVSPGKLNQDAWYLIGQAGDVAGQIVAEYRRDPTDSAGLLAQVEDFRAYWSGAEAILGIDDLPEDTQAREFLRGRWMSVTGMVVALRAQCGLEGGQQESAARSELRDLAAQAKPVIELNGYDLKSVEAAFSSIASQANVLRGFLLDIGTRGEEERDCGARTINDVHLARYAVSAIGAMADQMTGFSIVGNAAVWLAFDPDLTPTRGAA